MSYIVLARKWRPMKFEDVVGQEHVSRTLVNALQEGRLGHAFIFAGPRGVGKTTTARLLARAVNNQDKADFGLGAAEDDPQKLDVIEIDGASNRGIDEIRNLRENVRIAPASSAYKVYIIDEFHMLSKEAFNALLKTLEEPPPHALFIFATTEIHRVPLTILSRCQRFDFKRIPTAAIAAQLEKIATQEKIDIDSESLTLIARKADGGMRDATSILDQLSSFSAGKITVEQVQSSLGIIGEELYFEYTDLLKEKKDGEIILFVGRVSQQGHDLMNFVQGLEAHFRNLMLTRATGGTSLLETSDYIKGRYQEKAAEFETADLIQYLEILTQNESILKFSENPQLILELLLLKIAHKPLSVDMEELLELLKNLPPAGSAPAAPGSGKPSGGGPSAGGYTPPVDNSGKPQGSLFPSAAPAGKSDKETKASISANQFAGLKNLQPKKVPVQPEKAVETAVVEAPAPVETNNLPPALNLSLENISENWTTVVEAVRKEKIALASFLQDGVPYKLENGQLQIAFDPKTSFHIGHIMKNVKLIENALGSTMQAAVKIDCVKVDFEEKGIEKQMLTPEDVFESMKDKEPVLKKIIELFDCENMD